MKKETIEQIVKVANEVTKDQTRLKKSIAEINGAKNSHDLRRFLIQLIKRNFDNGNDKPLITLNEYVEYLFPDGTYWSEIRDLLTIAIYQKLHEEKIDIELPADEVEAE